MSDRPLSRPRPVSLSRLAAAVLIIAPLAVAFAAPLKSALSRPDNPHGKFRGECADCHGPKAWKPAKISPKFDHAKSGFPLEGAHAAADCKSCHASLDFTQEKQLCVSCHEDVHHGELGNECARCHTSRSFVDRAAMLRAHQLSRFPLTGSHASLECEQCHKPTAAGQMQFVGKQADCAGCHMDDYQATKVPDHAAGGFSTDCMTCHTTSRWQGARFNHDLSAFPLTGAHRTVDCATCHGDNVFNGKSTACLSCHQTDYNATSNPPHASAGYSTQCQTCHNTSGWGGSTFDHNRTAFPLTGAHRAAACDGCHGDGIYTGKSTACLSCHQTDYNATSNPPHASAGYSTQCQTCHSTSAWLGATFDHNLTAFPLTGAHRTAACDGCHGDGIYAGKSTACLSCHQTDYNATSNPPHASAGYSTQCQTCHSTSAWLGATFDHNLTAFPLTGAHVAAACDRCHGDGIYAGKSTACLSCHQTDYNATTNPPHASAGYSTQCQTCHSTSAWLGATFDHNLTAFPLTGAHVAAACAGCHGDGIYSGKSTLCVSCHQMDYDRTTNPAHGGAGFPLQCETCHTTTSWLGTTFDHDSRYFPISSGGPHDGTPCITCHTNPNAYAQFTCFVCHAHSDRTKMADKHSGVAGYQHDSQACYSCHPRGKKP